MAPHAHARSGAGRAAVAGGGGGDVVAAQCGRGRRGDNSREHAARRDGLVPGAPADAAGDPLAARERVSPGLGGTVGCLAASRSLATGPLCPRTLAIGTAVGGRGLRACYGHAESRMRGQGRATEATGEKVIHYQHLMKNLPLKASPAVVFSSHCHLEVTPRMCRCWPLPSLDAIPYKTR